MEMIGFWCAACFQLLSVTWARICGVLTATAVWMMSRSAAWFPVPVLHTVSSWPLRANCGAGVSKVPRSEFLKNTVQATPRNIKFKPHSVTKCDYWLGLHLSIWTQSWRIYQSPSFCFFTFSGRNDKGQLGHGDTKRLDAPKLIEALADHVIVAAACGRNHTMALTGQLSHNADSCGLVFLIDLLVITGNFPKWWIQF